MVYPCLSITHLGGAGKSWKMGKAGLGGTKRHESRRARHRLPPASLRCVFNKSFSLASSCYSQDSHPAITGSDFTKKDSPLGLVATRHGAQCSPTITTRHYHQTSAKHFLNAACNLGDVELQEQVGPWDQTKVPTGLNEPNGWERRLMDAGIHAKPR